LNFELESLLLALPAHMIAESGGSIGGRDDPREKNISKGEILMLAKNRIEQWEQQHVELEEENKQVVARVKGMEEVCLRMEGHSLML
jgi:hypothetical protein